MQQIEADQAHFLLHGVYLPELKNEYRLTKSIIAAIPPDKGDYRPDGISKSAMDLAWHIASTEMRFLDAVAAGEFDLSPRPRPDSIRNSADLAAGTHTTSSRASKSWRSCRTSSYSRS